MSKTKDEPWAQKYDLGKLPKIPKNGVSYAPTKERLSAVKGRGKAYCLTTVYLHEVGHSAEIVSRHGWLIALFPNRLDGKNFMGMLPDAKAAK